jgi:signal transduction histidine kinase
MLGNDLKQLPLTALATFAPLVFLQTGRDYLVVVGCLVAGHVLLLLAVLPPPSVPLTTVLIVIGGAIATGTAAGGILLVYRARLQQSLTWLQEALRAKSEFLNTMSHELRSPIHVVIGYADMVREEGVSATGEHALDRVRASALELLQLVENTMNAARLEAGKVPLRVEEFAPGDLAHELADGIRALPEAGRGVAVRWDVAPDLPPVRLDRLKVKEIVQNLVSNALKFTSHGEVRVSLGRDGDRLRIAVKDTGVGIPPEAQARIFGMFERVERSDGPAPAGVGLGLYIVNRLVELMRGRAALESAPGTGSCFTVQLPLRLE